MLGLTSCNRAGLYAACGLWPSQPPAPNVADDRLWAMKRLSRARQGNGKFGSPPPFVRLRSPSIQGPRGVASHAWANAACTSAGFGLLAPKPR